MRGIVQLFSMALLVSSVAIGPARSQSNKLLVGRWVARHEVPYAYLELGTDGVSRHYNDNVMPDSVILEFKSDNHGSIRWPNSTKIKHFTYRMVNSKLIEMQDTGKKPWRHTIAISSNTLSLGEYPTPKEPQESISILYTLTFVKQP
jgi:hypothetical protein